MNLPRIFAIAVARRLALVLVALALGWMGMGTARAVVMYPDQGAAYAGCMSMAASVPASGSYGAGICQANIPARYYTCVQPWNGGGATGPRSCGLSVYPPFDSSHGWSSSNSCSSRTPILNSSYTGNSGSCSGGCVYAIDTDKPFSSLTVNGQQIVRASSMSPTGDACTVGEKPAPAPGDQDACVQQAGLTQCLRSDGKHCAAASNGKQHCWDPTEYGIKASGNEATTKAPEGVTSKPPPLPPANGGDWLQQAVAQITTAINGQASNSTVTRYQSSYGAGGQGSSGHGADGEGKGGSGSGSGLGGSGSGSGSGDGEGDGEGDGPGAPGGQLGDLYTSDGKTVASVFQAFRTRVSDSPLIDAITNFFSAQGGGACPVFSISASTYWEAMSFDGHCSGDFLAALQSIGWVLMAAAALLAAYWALS